MGRLDALAEEVALSALATVREATETTLVTVEASAEAASAGIVAFMHTGTQQGTEVRDRRDGVRREVKGRTETGRVAS